MRGCHVELVNRTPFAAQRLLTVDTTGAEVLAAIVKATFRIAGDHTLSPADEQPPIVLADTFQGEPGRSSILAASDVHPQKPGCDLVLRGRVRPARPALAAGVRFRVGKHTKSAQVFGLRRWYRRLGFVRLSDPEPFTEIPLIWEHAFGGWDKTPRDSRRHACAVDNPVGRGFRAKRSRKDLDAEPLPNIEDPRRLITSPADRPPPVGFGFVGRDWQPRVGYAGTYDEAWQTGRMPLLPADFDVRYFDRAAPGLIAPEAPAPGTAIEAQGLNCGRDLRCGLPAVDIEAEVLLSATRTRLDFRLHTLLLDADAEQLQLTYGAMLPVHGRIDSVEAIVINGGWTP